MSRNTKIVVGIVGGLVVLCCISVGIIAYLLPRFAEDFVENNVTDDADRASEVGQSMLDYELPASLEEEGAMSVLGMTWVIIAPQSGGGSSAIMLMEFPESLAGDEDAMQDQMNDAFSQQTGQQGTQMEFVGTEEVVINDNKTVLTTFEGDDGNGTAVRQITGVFETKEGNTGMLMVFGGIDDWETGGAEEFLNSIR